MNRFFCSDIDSGFLDESESRHAAQVLRLGQGATASVFNGKGREVHVQLTKSSSKRVEFKIISSTQTAPAPYRLFIAQAVTKGKSWDLILQKLTELGIYGIYPIISDHSVVRVDDEKSADKTEKWQQTIIEACKQCGQNWLPVIFPAQSTADFLNEVSKTSLKLIASLQPEAHSLHEAVDTHRASGKALDEIVFMVGPEGDFTPSEIGQARSAGFLPVTLGPNVLRSETAAIYTASVLLHEMRH